MIELAPGEANCGLCRKAPGTGNGACPYRESGLQAKKAEVERLDCSFFKPMSLTQLDKRLSVKTDQESLF